MPSITSRCLLAVLAHPDDETFACGGTLAKYAAQGVRVALVCATRGEVGEISNPSLATPETLGQVREEELRAACRALGVEDLFILGYRDSGMDGTLDNRHPQALCQADLHEVTGRTVAIIRQLRPQVVLTFDPNGGYGHPDHIFVHRAAREAFAAAGDDSRYREQLARSLGVFSPQRLYYTGIPRSALKAFRQAIIDAGIESDLRDMDPETLGVPDEEITTVVDVGAYGESKLQAARCHRTQIQGDDPLGWVPEPVRSAFLSTEHLIRAEPSVPTGQTPQEHDLFDGIA